MTVDASTGWNTSSAFQTQSFDPAALSKGLQSAANYDPTQQSTTTPTSVSQFLPETMQSQNTQGATPQTPDTSTTSPTTAANFGLTSAGNNTPFTSYTQSQPQSKLAAGSFTPATMTPYAPNIAPAQAVPAAGTGTLTQNAGVAATNARAQAAQQVAYSGPQVVMADTGQGYGQYYKWNSATGTYQYVGSYGVNDQNNPFAGQKLQSYTLPAGANDLAYINQQQAGNIGAWLKQVDAQVATNATTAATSAANQTYQQTLNYLTTHGGQLDANTTALLNQQFGGANQTALAQQDAIRKAQADYQAQITHAHALSSIAMRPVDTSAVDASNQAALNSYISQSATAGDARGNAFGAASLGGQGELNRQAAAATSYNANLTNFGNALDTQYKADSQATGNQLFQDIQGVQQIAAQLQQEMGQLGTKAQAAVQQQLDALNQLLAQYGVAVRGYGQNSQQAMNAAQSILSAAGSVAAAVA